MDEHLLIGLAAILVLGVAAQWLAWLVRLPSILMLLLFGFVAGPLTGYLNPDALLGELLFPLVSLSVAIILFEGGLGLKLAEFKKVGAVVWRLITVGALCTWGLASVAAYWLLGLDLNLSLLFGSIVVVTGPTVILPLLRHLRPPGPVGTILKWEGIVIDPIGAILAVLVFGVILAGGFDRLSILVLQGFLFPMLVGTIMGVLGAALMAFLLKRYLVADYLQNAVSLMLVVLVFTLSNHFKPESGLLAVTLMGIVLANWKGISVSHILEFKENLRVLLISTLFILLAARLDLQDLQVFIQPGPLLFLAVLIFVARPITVSLCTIGSKLKWQEKAFLAWLAPRGIVAAAVASIFSLRLVEAGYPQAEALVPLTFLVIVGTVLVYGLSASPVARWLGVAQPNPQGVLIIGAHTWARDLGLILKNEGYAVVLVDDSWENISAARMAGLKTYYANILSEHAMNEIDLGGLGRLMALTPNDEVNSLSVLHFDHIFGKSKTYQLPYRMEKNSEKDTLSLELHGRLLFSEGMTYSELTERFLSGAVIKKTVLTEEFDFEAFKTLYEDKAIPLFRIDPDGDLSIFTTEALATAKPGQILISVVDEVEEDGKGPHARPPSNPLH